MTNAYQGHFDALNRLFSDKFTEAYQGVKQGTRGSKKKTLKYVSALYRRWYYSALIEDTVLSPASLFYMLNKEHAHPLQTCPTVRVKKAGSGDEILFGAQEYSLDNHPVIADLRLFIESCVPDVELNEDDNIVEKHMNRIIGSLSISDPFYADYLLLVAVYLDLIKKIPSIYSNRAQVTGEFEKLYKLDNKKIFERIVRASADIAASYIGEMLPAQEMIFNSEFILEILKKPITTDEIFQHIYKWLGIPFEEFWKLDSNDYYDELNNALMSSTFLLGIMLDKYFFTVFGHYLQLIRPLYLIPFDFNNEFSFIMETIKEKDGLITSLFAPCSNYHLTDMGLQYFDVAPDHDNYQPLKTKIPFEVLFKMVYSKLNMPISDFSEINEYFKREQEQIKSVLEIKARLKDEKSLWKNVEIPSNATLHNLFMEICYIFNFDPDSDYSFFTDASENPFSQYTSRRNPRKSKKADEITLEELDFSEKHRFVLAIYNCFNPYVYDDIAVSRVIKIDMDVLKLKERRIDVYYPRVSRESQAFLNMEIDLEF